jgi:ABC-type glutathione transport system ATPase component
VTTNSPLLDARLLSKNFPIEGGVFRRQIGVVQALKDVSFTVQSGETLAVVGGSGCGKSTLAKIISGLIKSDSGELLWQGARMDDWSRQQRARRVQMVFQDPFASLNPKLSIGTQLREVLRLAQPSALPREVDAAAAELLDTVGLSAEVLGNYPFQFSGGQRQRIAIARALAMKPALLIADEPLSALDVTIQAHILALLSRLKKDYGLTILFISHDLAVVESFADRALVMQNGVIVEQGPVSQILSQPQHAYTAALLAAVPRILQ